MASHAIHRPTLPGKNQASIHDPTWVRVGAILTSLGFVGLFLVLPLAAVFIEAFRGGLGAYWKSFKDPAAWQAIQLTLVAAGVALPLNLFFGVVASFAMASLLALLGVVTLAAKTFLEQKVQQELLETLEPTSAET